MATATKKAEPKKKAKKIESGFVYIQSTFNNTRVMLTDMKGGAVFSTSSGSLGFAGAKKGTPFAAAKAGEIIGDKAKELGVKNVSVIIKGVGAGRESALRSFMAKGININSIKDTTPVPHNGVKAKKPRRV
jgi:small subunit ribosomal protein S11